MDAKRERILVGSLENLIFLNRDVIEYKSMKLQRVEIDYLQDLQQFEMVLSYNTNKFVPNIVPYIHKLERMLESKLPPGKGVIQLDELGDMHLKFKMSGHISSLTHFITFLSPCVRYERLKMRYLKAISMPLFGFALGALGFALGIDKGLCVVMGSGLAMQGILVYLQDRHI